MTNRGNPQSFAPMTIGDMQRWITQPASHLAAEARVLRDAGHGNRVSYSRKVFIPLTKLCRNVCHYCVFAEAPRRDRSAYLSSDEVLSIARAGQAAGCKEALFTLGDKPEDRYSVAEEFLRARGHASTIDYLAEMCDLVFRETGLFPHVNPGVLTGPEISKLRAVAVSQGLMLETSAERLCERGGVHYGSPDKSPKLRLETIRLAGEAKVPFTTGILIGIGETRLERLESLLAIRRLHEEFGHIQEVIIQNFRAKRGTKLQNAAEPDSEDLVWTIAVARLIFGPAMNIQAPPNLSFDKFSDLVDAGLNDWGGVSPVTPDHVNPEAAWPHIGRLSQETARKGKVLTERLASYPSYVGWPQLRDWHDQKFVSAILDATDADGLARYDDWTPGRSVAFGWSPGRAGGAISDRIRQASQIAQKGGRLGAPQLVALFEARGAEVDYIAQAADELRASSVGDRVTYVINRNINYTNICAFKCSFCAFSKGSTAHDLRGAPYDIGFDEIIRRAREGRGRGATEVCLQGGIHPHYTGRSYLDVCRAIRHEVPELHIHAFSPLEVSHGAKTTGLSVRDFLLELRSAGLGSLPGTAAEILDDSVRQFICPDKLSTESWLDIMRTAHMVGLRSTSTIMFGHIESPISWARHLLAIRDLQNETGGFTEFVPLPFVHMEAPMYLRGGARRGPTSRESILMHAVARLALHPLIPNIQVSWVKLGIEGAKLALRAGANDLGGSLMNESISRAAGTAHGQELAPPAMVDLIQSIGRQPAQRNTLYGDLIAEGPVVPVNELSPSINEAPIRGGRARLSLPWEPRSDNGKVSEVV